ncbi:MAG: hypothetical protein AAFV53_27815 [Myxococcota bacterium]
MDRVARLAYAKRRQADGDPHGELIQVQCALEDAPDDADLQERDAALRRVVLGPQPRGVHLNWTQGFVTALTISGRRPRDLGGEWLSDALAHPALSQLASVVVNRCPDLSAVFAMLAALPASTAALTVNVWRPRRQETPLAVTASDLACISGHPGLRSIDVVAGEASVPALSLPALESLSLRCVSLLPVDIAQQSASALPSLQALSLYFGHPAGGGPGHDDARTVLDRLPAGLRRLSLGGGWFGDGLCAALPGVRWLAGLQQLAMPYAAITDGGGAALIAKAAAFSHLQSLDLRGNALSASQAAAVVAALPTADVRDQRVMPSASADEEE